MIRKILLSSIIFIVISFGYVLAQGYLDKPNDNRIALGLFGGVNYNIHSAAFTGVDFPQIPSCCPRFESGSGIGFNGGLLFNLPLSDRLTLQFRALYSILSAKLTTIESEYFPLPDGSGVMGEFEHSVDSKISLAGLLPMIGYRATDNFTISAGLRGGLILDKVYHQKEVIVSPSTGTFQGTNSRVRNDIETDMKNYNSFNMALALGAGYSLPLNTDNTLQLVPEVYYFIALNDILKSDKWKANQLTAGIALVWSPRKVKPVKPPALPPLPPPALLPPPPPSVPVLDATIAAVAVDEKGNESSIARLKVEQFLSTRMHPLLNYVFFDENSQNIPSRYKWMTDKQKKEFSLKNLYSLSTLDVYHNILNIIGKRISMYPQAEITLTGCNADFGTEKGNTALSRQRAESVKDYLVKVWGIQDSRIKIETRNLPALPSNQTNIDGQQENRRVEISSNVDRIFEPIIVQDTLVESNPPVFRFKPDIKTPIGVQSWRIITEQSSGELKIFSGAGAPPKTIEWDLSKEYEVVPRLNEPLNYKLEVIDNDNKKWQSLLQSLPVEQMTIEKKILEQIADKEIDKFSLILFAYDKADLGAENQKIAEFAKRRIQRNSIVNISGFTDRSGDDKHNLDLSQRRATATAKALGVDPKFAKGMGEMKLLYDNDLPEGRFYCRTVNIEIITPIKYE